MRYLAILASLGPLLAASPAFARTWHITSDGLGDAATIQAGVDSSAVGDTVLVGPGTFYENVSLKSDLHLLSDMGAGGTTLDGQHAAAVLRANGSSNVVITGFTIVNGEGSGGDTSRHGGGLLLEYCGAGITVSQCVFRDNHAWAGGAIMLWHSESLTCTDNLFESNTATAPGPNAHGLGGAISIVTGPSPPSPVPTPLFHGNTFVGNRSDRGGSAIESNQFAEPTIVGNLFVDNFDSGMRPAASGVVHIAIYASELSNNTFYGNVSGAVLTFGPNGAQQISNTIIAFNDVDQAILCEGGQTFNCTNIYGNSGDDWTGCAASYMGTSGNSSTDPLFCGPEADDFTLRSDSPCAPANSNGCGLIGALPVGCGPVAVEATTWGQIKGAYR